MKLEDRMIDLTRREEGAWVKDLPDMEDLELKVRGHNNKDWLRMEKRLIDAVPRQRRLNGLETDDRARINRTLIRETVLLDWRNITNGNGEPVPYSKEQADKYLSDPRYEPFFNACMYAALIVAEQGNAEIEADAKN